MENSNSYFLKKINSDKTKYVPYFWLLIILIVWSLLYLAYTIYLVNSTNEISFIISFIFCVILLGFLQEILINKYIRIFPYWIITDILGVFSGFLYFLLFSWSIITLDLKAGEFVTNFMNNNFRTSATFYLMTIIILLTTGVVFFVFTYGIWIMIINPIQKSEHINEKAKLLFGNILVIAVSLFLSLSVLFSFLLLFNSNMLISTFLSVLLFSFITYSGFKDIFIENSLLKPFGIVLFPSEQIH